MVDGALRAIVKRNNHVEVDWKDWSTGGQNGLLNLLTEVSRIVEKQKFPTGCRNKEDGDPIRDMDVGATN
jgi:hypothetical protein